MDNYKILKQLEIREKRAKPYKYYDKDELIDEILKLEDKIEEVREYIEKEKAKLPLGRNDFTCEMVYSDEVVLAKELLEILDKVDKENK